MSTKTIQELSLCRQERADILHILESRIHNLVDGVISEVSNDKRVAEALELNDKELMKVFFISYLESQSKAKKREMKKIEKRISSTVSFYNKLEQVGGFIKAKDVSSLLSVTRQTVNNRVNKNKLLAIRKGGDYLFPLFQFEDLSLLPKFEDVMQAMPEDVDSYLRFSFFVNKLKNGFEMEKTPIEIIKSGDEKELSMLKRSASLFCRHVSN